MDGILLVDKPAGWTSHDVVAKVRSILRQNGLKNPKVGHTGTLDPLATGLLVLLIGNYTKKAQEFSKLDKTYEVTIKLGQTSTTGDEEGMKTAIGKRQPHIKEINEILKSFIGEIEQVPPAYSAIKIGGKRAYKLARAGQKVEIKPRKVKIYSIEKIVYKYPVVSFSVEVSRGTYIRSLAEDIGQNLGVGAYLTALKRTSIGNFSLEKASSIEEIYVDKIGEI